MQIQTFNVSLQMFIILRSDHLQETHTYTCQPINIPNWNKMTV
jgi:hypothetical protein